MLDVVDFAVKKRRKKKTRNCTKGYNCGNSCINKGLKCRRKFTDQASNYADWLKKQANNLSGSFDKEVGKRLSKEANSKLDITRAGTPVDTLLPETMGLIDRANDFILNSDRRMLKITKRWLKNGIGDKEKNKAEIADLEARIAKREKEIKARTPQNQINKFIRPDVLDKELFKLNDSKNNVENLLNELKDLRDLIDSDNPFSPPGNQIVPFKKRRSSDFAESTDLLSQYFVLTNKLEKAIAILEQELAKIL